MLAFVNVTDVVWIRLRFQPIWFHGSSDVPFERCTPISREYPTRAHIASYHKEIPPHSDGRKTGLWMINPDGICKVQGSCNKIWRARSFLYRSRVLIWNSKTFRDLQAFRTLHHSKHKLLQGFNYFFINLLTNNTDICQTLPHLIESCQMLPKF